MSFYDKNEDLEKLVKDLLNDLDNSDPRIREKAARKFSNESKAWCFESDGTPTYKDRIEKFNELIRGIALDSIINKLNDPNRLVKVSLVWCLGSSNDSRVIDPLITSLEDNEVRKASIINLVRLNDKSVQPLIKALNNENSNIRRGSVSALGDIGDKRALDPLINSLQDKDWNVKFKAIEALCKLGDNRSLEPISKCLDDKSAKVRVKQLKLSE